MILRERGIEHWLAVIRVASLSRSAPEFDHLTAHVLVAPRANAQRRLGPVDVQPVPRGRGPRLSEADYLWRKAEGSVRGHQSTLREACLKDAFGVKSQWLTLKRPEHICNVTQVARTICIQTQLWVREFPLASDGLRAHERDAMPRHLLCKVARAEARCSITLPVMHDEDWHWSHAALGSINERKATPRASDGHVMHSATRV